MSDRTTVLEPNRRSNGGDNGDSGDNPHGYWDSGWRQAGDNRRQTSKLLEVCRRLSPTCRRPETEAWSGLSPDSPLSPPSRARSAAYRVSHDHPRLTHRWRITFQAGATVFMVTMPAGPAEVRRRFPDALEIVRIQPTDRSDK